METKDEKMKTSKGKKPRSTARPTSTPNKKQDGKSLAKNTSKPKKTTTSVPKPTDIDKTIPKTKDNSSNTIITVLIIALLTLVMFNQYNIAQIGSELSAPTTSSAAVAQVQLSGDPLQDAINVAIPTGTPEIYGNEIGVSFDDPIASLDILDSYDRRALAIDFNTMTDEQKQRYIYVGQRTTCEYCCGATSNVFKDGRPACGCAHSAAMRGVAKYIITEHGAEYTDDQIITEMNRWKALFFPKQTIQKVLAAQQETGQLDASALNDLPGMVGGC